jgi:hypothetical protein
MHPQHAANATPEQMLAEILDVVTQLRDGHFSTHLTDTFPGVGGEIAKALNAHLEFLKAYRDQHLRLMEEIGVTGRLGGQVWLPDDLPKCEGAWKDLVEATNRMAYNLTAQFRDGGNVIAKRLAGDADAWMTAEHIAGEFREVRESTNELLDRAAVKA